MKSGRRLIPNFSNKHILIVEDDKGSLLLLENMLNPTNIRITVANNGSEAIKILQSKNDISLILMDIHMPIMDGIETAIGIRKINTTIPIIAQSAFTSHKDKTKCIEAGFNAFISKPVDIRYLYDTIWASL